MTCTTMVLMSLLRTKSASSDTNLPEAQMSAMLSSTSFTHESPWLGVMSACQEQAGRRYGRERINDRVQQGGGEEVG